MNIILFDGVCNLCNSWVIFIIKRDKEKIFRFASLQNRPIPNPQSLIPNPQSHILVSEVEPLDSVIYLRNQKYYYKSSAALRILSDLGGLYRLFSVFLLVPPFIRNFVYDLIARNRYKWFGKKEQCMVPDEDIKDRFLT